MSADAKDDRPFVVLHPNQLHLADAFPGFRVIVARPLPAGLRSGRETCPPDAALSDPSAPDGPTENID